MASLKKHLRHVGIQKISDQLSDYEYDEALETLKEIAEELGVG